MAIVHDHHSLCDSAVRNAEVVPILTKYSSMINLYLCECEFVSSIVYENSDQDDYDDKDDENSDYET